MSHLVPYDLLNKVLEHARQWLKRSTSLADPSRARLLAQADWLEELLTNFDDEIDNIADEQADVGRLPGPITWMDGNKNRWQFLPSEALNGLLSIAREADLPPSVATQAAAFCSQYGSKLDAILTVIDTSSIA